MADYRLQIKDIEKKKIEVAERIRFAKEQGDLSENAEYKSAVEERATLNDKHRILVEKVTSYENYMESSLEQRGEIITLGSVVKIYCPQLLEHFIIKIVPAGICVPAIGAIGEDVILAKRLLNEVKGNVVKVVTNSSIREYQILEVL